jgi:predicted homoserine dehydrogenase-like protein
LHAIAVADLLLERARASLARAGWAHDRIATRSIGDALKDGTTHLTEGTTGLIAADGLEVLIDATGKPLNTPTGEILAFGWGRALRWPRRWS